VIRDGARLRRLAVRLGYRFEAAPLTSGESEARLPDSPRTPRHAWLGQGAWCAASVCTRNHLHFARVLAASFGSQHHGVPLFLLVVDGEDGDRQAVAGATVLTGRDIGYPAWPYLALKLSATELCCTAKPRLLQYIERQGAYGKVVYLDSDVLVMAPLSRMLQALERASFCVTPHLLSPIPHPERVWERPTLGEVAAAGVMNAGVFGLKRGEASSLFLQQWRELCEAPGSFELSSHEQHAFNWVTCFTDEVAILRDPAYNVAYWNLHERALRFVKGASRSSERWLVGEDRLVAFHFSGFDPDCPLEVSRFDQRHAAHHHDALARLLEYYGEELQSAAADGCAELAYGFGAFPSGVPIDARIRRIFRSHELVLASDLDPWSAEGERHYCRALLQPVPGAGSLLPAILMSLLEERTDLRALLPEAHLDPTHAIRWFSLHGAAELGYERLFDLHRPVVPRWEGLLELREALARVPEPFLESDEPCLAGGRTELRTRLRTSELALRIGSLALERYELSPLELVRRLTDETPPLRELYPDLLFADARRFEAWLRLFGSHVAFLPNRAVTAFARTAKGRSLARVFALMSRHWPFMERFPLGLLGDQREGFVRTLLEHAGRTPEFDVDDVVMLLWLLDERPEAGLELTLALPVNALRRPPPTTRPQLEELLRPVLDREPRVRAALDRHLGRLEAARPARAPDPRTGARHRLVNSASETHPRRLLREGVNLFGFFKSPIGLGTMSKGLEQALASADIVIRRQLIPHQLMDADLGWEDFLPSYDETLDTNVFVDYPHNGERVLEVHGREATGGRRNVAYLAWEQSQGHYLWEQTYRDYDAVWTLSRFAADALVECLGRPVEPVPCVVDSQALPPPASKLEVGLDPSRTVFLTVFDPNSSQERKNPEGVIAAFGAAFRPSDPVQLVVRMSGYHAAYHRRSLARLVELATATDLDVELLVHPLSRSEVLRLMSAADAYVSLHRCEGFGLTCAEAMLYRKPVIATGYSGNMDYMDAGCALPVDWEETEVRIPDGPFRCGTRWAEPNLEHAAALMRQVYEDPHGTLALGRRARQRVLDQLSAERVGARVRELLYPSRVIDVESPTRLLTGSAPRARS
jgi:glycosyltransferase involved in cell wall biosynthesis